MTQEEFYREACLRAMEGLLSAAGHYRDELIANPCEYVATAARHYATELTEQVYGGGVQWNEITHTPDKENIFFAFFKAGQESMEEGGKGFDQYYNETFKSE